MTSTVTGLPDRYRPLDQVGPDEPTPTGVIRTYRAKDRVLNRDVAIRVHTPGGPAAHAWIARALTAGGLATPALAMVYDAAEGNGDAAAADSAAYVVNEWIDGETLAERLTRGPLQQREARTVVRRLAEGVAEAHRVGLAVGGLTPEHVVLRPNGLVGLRGVPAASGTVQGDITALGALLEACLGGPTAVEAAGRGVRKGAATVPPDLAALVRRARSTEPGQGLSSVAAMVSLLNERPRAGGASALDRHGPESDRLRSVRQDDVPPPALPVAPPAPTVSVDAPVRLDPMTMPPVPPVRPVAHAAPATQATPVVQPGPPAPPVEDPWTATGDGWRRPSDDLDAVLHEPTTYDDVYDDYPDTGSTDLPEVEEPGARRRAAVIGISIAALAVVIALAWWFGTNVLSVAGSVDEVPGSTPPPTSTSGSASSSAPATGAPAAIVSAEVYNPEGDGEPENDDDVPLSFDGDPGTAWSTLTYFRSPAFGNLKSGVGIMYDLGSEQQLAGVTVTTSTPGITVEVRTGGEPDGPLDAYQVAASGTVDGETPLQFQQPATARFVLVWVTGLVPSDDGFAGDIAEVAVSSAG
ncbi:hypothetical protein ACI797_04015 [Geodermatophilus sp. SYSU D00691]